MSFGFKLDQRTPEIDITHVQHYFDSVVTDALDGVGASRRHADAMVIRSKLMVIPAVEYEGAVAAVNSLLNNYAKTKDDRGQSSRRSIDMVSARQLYEGTSAAGSAGVEPVSLVS